jgi:hypothetical protein
MYQRKIRATVSTFLFLTFLTIFTILTTTTAAQTSAQEKFDFKLISADKTAEYFVDIKNVKRAGDRINFFGLRVVDDANQALVSFEGDCKKLTWRPVAEIGYENGEKYSGKYPPTAAQIEAKPGSVIEKALQVVCSLNPAVKADVYY